MIWDSLVITVLIVVMNPHYFKAYDDFKQMNLFDTLVAYQNGG